MANRLSNESSLYLKQHQEDLFEWWSYGPEAIQRAKDENKPIFLSIGFSSCHWCHVMQKETFNNPEVAEFFNKNFINIKVDREEWPDIDHYYQQACQLFTQHGGWPLSTFLLPDLRPFFAGTYFPPLTRGKATGLLELGQELIRALTEEKDKVLENAEQVSEQIRQGLIPSDKVEFEGHYPPPSAILNAIEKFRDKENGGYGESPKFPQFAFYEWALEQMLEGMVEKEFGDSVIQTLENMLMGGIFDQARGGIHRYSTDEAWRIPHFEKMLYDQAGLLRVLAKLSLLYPSPLVYDSLIMTLDYLHSEMLSEKGYFFSSQDAESEGVEGLYQAFTETEFEDAINQFESEDNPLAEKMEGLKTIFSISKEGNFHSDLNIPQLNRNKKSEIFTQENWDLVRDGRKAMLEARKLRMPPASDTKGIAGQNFMMVSALVEVMQYCRLDVVRKMASNLFNKCLEGIFETFMNKDEQGRMRILHSTSRPDSLPYLEDYVFFAESQLRVYEITGNPVFRDNFRDTMKYLEKEFLDHDKVYFRARFADDFEPYPNLAVSHQDTNYRGASATLILLAKRGAILFGDQEFAIPFKELAEVMTHQSLKNPIVSGEALRALSYPDRAYRTVKVPKKWLENEKFLGFMPYFLSRFTLDYVEDTDNEWQICRYDACELKGTGVDDFIGQLTPKAPEGENN